MATTPPKLSSATTSFASAYKYKVAGKTDLLFMQIGSLFADDKLKFSLFKSKRYNETVAQANIAANPNLSDSEKKIAGADRKTLFLTDATRALKQNIDSKTSPRKIANAINQIVKELQLSVRSYIEARGGSTSAVSGGEDGGVTVDISSEGAAASGGYDAAQDQAFLNRVELMVSSLKKLLLAQKGPLRTMGKYFDLNYYQADRRLGEITQAINNFTAPPAPVAEGDATGEIPAAPESADTPPPPQQDEQPQGLDITV
ncbi:MAG: hypothetical protein Q8K65_10070 [Alphaproteobacteria bacterium]|nr:hypothetical protein [Alphaproteobacteria bacterium]